MLNQDEYNTNKLEETFIPRMCKSSTLYGHTGCVNCLKWSPDGSILISGSDDTCVNMWDMTAPTKRGISSSSNRKAVFKGHTSNVFAVEFVRKSSLSASRVVSGSNDADCRVFDLSTGKLLHVLKQFTRKVYDICSSSTCENTFLACSSDGTVRHYDLRDKMSDDLDSSERVNVRGVMPQIFGGGPTIKNPKVSLDNLLLDFARDSQHFEIYSVDFHPNNGNLFLVSVSDGKAYLFDLRKIGVSPIKSALSVYCNNQFRNPKSNHPSSACFGKYGTEVLISCMNESMYLFDSNIQLNSLINVETLSLKETRRNIELRKEEIQKLGKKDTREKSFIVGNMGCLLPVASATSDENREDFIRDMWDEFQMYNSDGVHGPIDETIPINYKMRYRGHTHRETLKKVGFYGENHVVTGADDGCVYIYHKDSGELRSVLTGGNDIVNVVEKSPVNFDLACSGLDSFITLWQPRLTPERIGESVTRQRDLIERTNNQFEQ